MMKKKEEEEDYEGKSRLFNKGILLHLPICFDACFKGAHVLSCTRNSHRNLSKKVKGKKRERTDRGRKG
jgi:hypothetical protein